MTIHELPSQKCPKCGRVQDACTNTQEDRAPRAGDVTVCFYCAARLELDAGLRLRELSAADLVALDPVTRNQLELVARSIVAWRRLN